MELEEEEAEDGEKDERDFEEEVCEGPEDAGEWEGFGEKAFGDGVRLLLEPMQAGEDEERTGKGGGGSGDHDTPLSTEQPEGGRDHYEDA